jgi:hypothetical protein
LRQCRNKIQDTHQLERAESKAISIHMGQKC